MGGGPVGASLGVGRAKTAGQAQERLVAPAEEEAGLEARTLTPPLALTLTLTPPLALTLTLTRTLNLALTRRASRPGRRSSPPAETVRRRARRGRRARRSGSRRSLPTGCTAAAPRLDPSLHSSAEVS